jgi:hypothetical protein
MLTTKMLNKWFLYINQELFDNMLDVPAFYIMTGKELIHTECGQTFESSALDGLCLSMGENNYMIALDGSMNQYHSFITLVHEMIHIWQMENGKPCGHSGWFRTWTDKAIEAFPFTTLENLK